ncbi:DNA cytosine methyltransferase [Bacillus pumilus]|uniref:DNA cytosine methyltransferase n=1 Tax=Bacillus pumilus TaxID=1408 RepID=UPI003D7274B8
MLIKKRTAKPSERGIYIQDAQLLQTQFEVGRNFDYIIDPAGKSVTIVPAEQTKNTVSKRAYKGSYKPVIDIRKKDALQAFAGVDQLEIEIFDDQILIRGVKKTALTNNLGKIRDFFSFKTIKKKEKRALKQNKLEVLLSKNQLDQVVGDSYQQFSIFDYLDASTTRVENNATTTKLVDHLKIPLQIISLFSGAGIFDQGFVEEGFTVKLALEKDAEAIQTYRTNLGGHIQQADLTNYDFTKLNDIKAPIMIGGSPCQGFSSSNRKTSFLENPNNLLVKKYIEAVKANTHCKVFVLENVPEILTAGNGQFRDEIIKELSEFTISYGVINAVDMGSAQKRKRAIFIGSKIGRIDLPKTTVAKYKTVGEAFANLDDSIPNQTDISKSREDTIERMRYVKQGENWTSIPDHLKNARMLSGKTHSLVYRRLKLDEPSITIANPRKNLITHPIKNRILSVRECARLFGLKDSFIFRGSLSSMQQQIANAVPVEIGKAIAKVIKKAINSFNKHPHLVQV